MRRQQQLSLLAAAAALLAAAGPAGAAPAVTAAAPATTHRLSSPSGRIEVAVEVGPRIAYGVSWDSKPLLRASTLSLDVDHTKLGVAPVLTGTRHASVDRQVTPPVRLSAATLPERYDELRLEFAGGYAVVFRAYDQGVAYRFETALPAREVKVYGEEATFAFAADADAYYPKEDGFFAH
jgi:alpha-glucosidase